jgi:DHA1 family bicyclomycin/chloramphenicol resistance-like MFS transporter
MTLSSYFIGISAGQLLYGPLLDRFGRKRNPYFWIISLHTSFISLCFRNRYRYIHRITFVQAIGLCSDRCIGIYGSRLISQRYSKVFSLLMLVVGLSC